MRFPRIVSCFVCVVLSSFSVLAQSPNGNVNGQILDSSGAVIVAAEVVAVNDITGVQYTTKTNNEGIYVLPSIPPGPYRLQVSKVGFKTVIKPDIILNVQDALSLNFTLPAGATFEVLTVEGGAPLVNTESASVSTVIDRQFAEDIPMNGRSFQTLIQLTPGVVTVPSNSNDNGQFSINGQRSDANYWMVDGVSANIGVGSNYYSQGNGVAGALPSFSILGGTNSLVSVDAMQEFRIQTSTYAPEFGRTPGGQVSVVTRSGTNQVHGTLFDYLRNDIFDANDWFGDANRLQKPEERQNDFGGTVGGPILRDRAFFFFSYEGLRLRLPQVSQSNVPDIAARENAIPAMQPYINAFPLPSQNGTDDVAAGIAEFNASYSNASSLDAYSLRLDHKVSSKVNLFGRYNYSPSNLTQRGNGFSANTLSSGRITSQTATAGVTWMLSSEVLSDLRFNYSRTNSSSHAYEDNFGGAVPLSAPPFPSSFSIGNSLFAQRVVSLQNALYVGSQGQNVQQQFNTVDNLTLQRGSHGLKFGVDIRRLSPLYEAPQYYQQSTFSDVPGYESGQQLYWVTASDRAARILLHNLGLFAQDTWLIRPHLTVTYGLRWDVDEAPSSTPPLSAVENFNVRNLASLTLAPVGTAPFRSTFGNLAPRLGLAYGIGSHAGRETILRAGAGIFYDLATSELGNILFLGQYPFGAQAFGFGTFPLSPANAAPPAIAFNGSVFAFDPHLQLPMSAQWNASVEQALGHLQSLTASYVGSAGRRLIQSAYVSNPSITLASAYLITNSAESDYDALQLQFQRRMDKGLQALASYTWSHSIDNASAGSLYGNTANALLPGLANANRGPSDTDIRHALAAAMIYNIPAPASSKFEKAVLSGWSVESIVQARSAPPVTVYEGQFFSIASDYAQVRPDVISGIPLYLFGRQYPAGKAFNYTPGAVTGGCMDGSESVGPFCPPPTDASGNPLRQGNMARNALRGFGAFQWDLAIHRDFPIREAVKLQFRAELFNAVNHPNFAPPVADLSNQSEFGRSIQTLAQYFAGANVGGGAFSPLYQIGGARSVQFALKLFF